MMSTFMWTLSSNAVLYSLTKAPQLETYICHRRSVSMMASAH
jgi:hypothetical protein